MIVSRLIAVATRAQRFFEPSSQTPRPVQSRTAYGDGVGNGSKPTCLPAQLGRFKLAPLVPHAVQRAQRLSLSLDSLASPG